MLTRCPFKHRKSNLRISKETHYEIKAGCPDLILYYVECKICGCYGPSAKTEHRVIWKWNKRIEDE